MPFDISVYLPHTEKPFPDAPEEYDAWMEEELKYCIYDNPLGPGGAIYDYWHVIACDLNLSMISRIYNEGLKLQSIGDFSQLESELDIITDYWNTYSFVDEESSDDEIREYLKERSGYLKEALKVAREKGGILTIS